MEQKLTRRDFGKIGTCAACGLLLPWPLQKIYATGQPPAHVSSPEDLWKWSKEAAYYIQTPKGIKCKLCPQACEIKEEGGVSDCRTRIRKGDKLFCIAYGNPCAVHVDPVEKKPLYHFLPSTTAFSIATAGCNLACLNCQNWEISQKSPKETRNIDLMPAQVVEQANAYKCASIAYTYSDPVAFFEYAYDTSKLARLAGIKNLMISAGYINEQPLREMAKFMDAANIDLKSFSDEIYEMLNAGTLEPVLETLKILKDEGVWLEITNLVVPSWNDDFDMIRKMCDWLYDKGFEDNPLHFSRFHPLYKLTNLPSTPVETLDRAYKIAKDAGIKYVYVGNVPGHYSDDTRCPSCGEIVIKRKGFSVEALNIKDGKCLFCEEHIAGVFE